MKVSIPILFKNGENSYKRTIEFVNPDASNDDLIEFINKLNALTDNTLSSALRVVEDFLKRSDSDITQDDIDSIFNGDYQTQPVQDGITQADIDSIWRS